MSNDDEIQPYLIYRVVGNQFECALWELENGEKSLALFLTPEAAAQYLAVAGLTEEWKTHCPSKPNLLQILEHSLLAGIRYAVLNPDDEEARRLFDLDMVVAAAKESG
jgi:hypothetical protein